MSIPVNPLSNLPITDPTTDNRVNPLAMTSRQFADTLSRHLGKGRQHALALYSEYCKEGTLTANHPSFLHAKALAHSLIEAISLPNLEPKKVQREGDAIKFTLSLVDGYETESVILAMAAGNTLCVSSQVGCRMGCRFCETGRLGLIRNLTTAEIVCQLASAIHHFKVDIRNIVFMGMGEPMDNLESVIGAIEIISDPRAFNMGRRHITVSTSGHLDGLREFQLRVNPPVNLAVSVIAADEATRTRLMPVNRRWNMSALYQAMLEYCDRTKRQIFIEYVLIDGVNDTPSDANKLAIYLRGLDVKVNLIPYNAQSALGLNKSDDLQLRPSSLEACQLFATLLHQSGLRTFLRIRKGHDIMAACGQLGNLDWRKKKQASAKQAALNPPIAEPATSKRSSALVLFQE